MAVTYRHMKGSAMFTEQELDNILVLMILGIFFKSVAQVEQSEIFIAMKHKVSGALMLHINISCHISHTIAL